MLSLLESFQSRGLIHDVSNFDTLNNLLAKEKFTFYCGFDPTADSLHVGSMLPLILMRRLQAAGHRPIVLLGSATGMIGDPSGKSTERQLLSAEQIEENLAGIRKQLLPFFIESKENPLEIVENHQWLGCLNLLEYLRDVGKHFSVNSMILKDSVKSRLEAREQGISYTEFSYQILQAYDFYWLYQNKNCKLQVGGSDQWGNITAGIDFVKKKLQNPHTPVFGMTFPLLTTASGTKFGKSEQGTIWLDAKKTSPYRFYQYWLNTEDADVIRYLSLFTETSSDELDELAATVQKHPEERKAQKALAETLTRLVHGTHETEQAILASKAFFDGDIAALSEDTLREVFSHVPSTIIKRTELDVGIPLVDIMVLSKLAKSKAEARRAIEGGGIYLNDKRVSDSSLLLTKEHLLTNDMLILRQGKKNYHLLNLQ
ncbi:MAG: tyrosine--tRNA ligase [Deltaproteobacteria bacterium]|nr:tyrosine--tRNA ligase [Deltaproteobacteria bacterium]